MKRTSTWEDKVNYMDRTTARMSCGSSLAICALPNAGNRYVSNRYMMVPRCLSKNSTVCVACHSSAIF